MKAQTNSCRRVATVARLAVAIALLSAVSASATIFTISQFGWTGGGVITGSFSGQDIDNDGYIDLVSDEVSSYQVTFSGNALIASFTHDLSDLKSFRYTVGSSGFRPSFPLYSTDGTYFYDADDYTIARNDRSVLITATEGGVAHDALVVVVPEPATSMLFGAALCGILLVRYRRVGLDAFRLANRSDVQRSAVDF
jgi:PEP-CTERM motif